MASKPTDAVLKRMGLILETTWNTIRYLAWAKEIYSTTESAIEVAAEAEHEKVFSYFLNAVYFDSCVMAVRRLLDNDPRSLSFANLLRLCWTHSYQISRDWFVECNCGSMIDDEYLRSVAADMYLAWADSTGLSLSRAMIVADARLLSRIQESLGKLVNKRIAHTDDKPLPPEMERHDWLEELDRSVQTLKELFLKYDLIVRNSSHEESLLYIDQRWTEIFNRPIMERQ